MGQKITHSSKTNREKPYILYEGKHTFSDLKRLRKYSQIWKEDDIYKEQSRELFEITHPSLIATKEYVKELNAFIKERLSDQERKIRGNWIYFPWSGRLLHTVTKEEYTALRTNRNRNLITKEEQKRILDFCIAIVGLSVGSNIATTLAYSGIANKMKLSESDMLETTNLNRIRARIDQIGMKKIDIAAQQVYEINPYAELTLLPGLTKKTLRNFIVKKPRPQLIFEIIDSFEMKIHLRNLAKKYRIPVVMITNLGDRILIDVERYDISRNTQFFNGRAGKVPTTILRRPDRTNEDKHKYAVELAGIENIPKKALESVDQIGHTLVGRPQLASTVTVASGICSYVARKIALEGKLPSCSWLVDLDKIITSKIAL